MVRGVCIVVTVCAVLFKNCCIDCVTLAIAVGGGLDIMGDCMGAVVRREKTLFVY